MQDASKAGQSRADEARVFGEAFESLCRGREQGLVRQPWMGAAQGAQRFRHGEGDQEIRSGQLCTELVVQPLRGVLMLTLWTVSIATGMGDVMMVSTTFAGIEAIAVGAGAAAADGVNGLVVRGREIGRALDILWSVGGEDVAQGDHDDRPRMISF